MSSEPTDRTGLSFSVRLTLFYAAFFLIGYLVVFATAHFMIRATIAGKEREVVRERISEYRAWFLGGSMLGLRSRFEEQSRRTADLMFVRILGPGSSTLLFSAPKGQQLLPVEDLDRLASEKKAFVATLETTARPRNIWTVGAVPLPSGYRLQAGKISTAEFRALRTFRATFLRGILPVCLVALAGGAFLSYRAMRPIRDLTTTARSILETGDFEKRVRVAERSRGDLSDMGRVFNKLLERNQSLIQAMRDSLDNASHDLRTPMTRLRATAESALARPDDVAGAKEALADCLEESDRVLTMLNTLMDIAEAETGVMRLRRKKVDLVTLVRQVAEVYELVAEERGIRVEVHLPDALDVLADPPRLQQVVGNLLDNALKYGRDKGRVVIHASTTDDDSCASVSVSDDGAGIAPEDLPRIWDRLYRADRSRSQRGLGLGLSFVKAIVDAHGGEVSVTSHPGKGSTFSFSLPVRQATSSDEDS